MLAVELDDLTLGRLRAALRDSELTLKVVSAAEALELVHAAEVPPIVLLEWADDEETVELCRALQAPARSRRPHLLAFGGPSSQPSLQQALDGSVDDVLCRPFSEELLLGRLRQGLRAIQSAGSTLTPHDALREALASSSGGEVVFRSHGVTGVVHVQGGYVVWANLSSVPATMEEVVRHAGVSLDREIATAVKEECRTTGASFADVLVQWGVLEERPMREAVRCFLADRVSRIVALPDAAALFLPRSRPHSERFRFRASEIPSLQGLDGSSAHGTQSAPCASPTSRRLISRPPLDVAEIARGAMRLDGAVAAAVLDRKTGACLHSEGAELDSQVVWSQLGTLAALGPTAVDVLAASAERCFVTRALHGAPGLVLFVALDLGSTTVGMARTAIAQIAGQ